MQKTLEIQVSVSSRNCDEAIEKGRPTLEIQVSVSSRNLYGIT